MHTAEFTCHHIRQTKAGKTDFQERAWSETAGPQANLTLEASTIQIPEQLSATLTFKERTISTITIHNLATIKPFQFSTAPHAYSPSYLKLEAKRLTQRLVVLRRFLYGFPPPLTENSLTGVPTALSICLSSMLPQLVSLCLGAPPPEQSQRAPAVRGEKCQLHGNCRTAHNENYQLQNAGTSSIGKKKGRRQTRPTSNSGNLRAGGHLEKSPLPRERRKRRRRCESPTGPRRGALHSDRPPPPRPASPPSLCLWFAAPGRAAGYLDALPALGRGPLVAQLGQGPGHALVHGWPGGLAAEHRAGSLQLLVPRLHQPLVAPHCDERVRLGRSPRHAPAGGRSGCRSPTTTATRGEGDRGRGGAAAPQPQPETPGRRCPRARRTAWPKRGGTPRRGRVGQRWISVAQTTRRRRGQHLHLRDF